MRLMVHTLKKDIRHLWPVVTISWVVLASLTNMDRWRADWTPSQMESWMNVLLTMIWACLAGLVVLEEPLVGNDDPWLTRPQPRAALLGAKLLFVVLVIHLPSLVADIFILGTHGFPPVMYFQELVIKQVFFFGAITLPSIAIASVVRNFNHFVFTVFAVAALILVLNGGTQKGPVFNALPGTVRQIATLLLLATTATAVISIQYTRRRRIPARATALIGGMTATLLFTWMPVSAEYAGFAARSLAAPRIGLKKAPFPDGTIGGRTGDASRVVLLPISIAPGERTDRFRATILELEIIAPDGTRLKSAQPSRTRPLREIDLAASLFVAPRSGFENWLMLRFSDATWRRVRSARARISGTAAFDFYRIAASTSLPVDESANVAGVGRCAAIFVAGRLSDDLLKVLCESPRQLPITTVTLRDEAAGREWRERLNSSFTYSPGPNESWLSPLYRGQCFFHLTNADTSAAGSQWLVPSTTISSARIEIAPQIPAGRALARFDFADVPLAAWLVPAK